MKFKSLLSNSCLALIIVLFTTSMINVSSAQDASSKSSSRSIALVLKVNGDKDYITSFSIFSYSFFRGRVKSTYDRTSLMQSNCLRIKVYDENEKLVFDGYVENPLSSDLETFNADGTIEKVPYDRTEDYVNLRFALSELITKVRIDCFQMKNQEESLVSSINIAVK